MVIRPVRESDFATIAAITNHYITTTSIHFAYDPVSEDEIRGLWSRTRETHPWLVAEQTLPGAEAGPVVAYAKAGVWRDRAAYAWTCEVGLYVAADLRGNGIGTGIYTALLAECAQRGFRSAVAGITLPNDASVALHQKLGFEHVGTFLDAGWKQDAWHPVDWWQKRFSTDARGPTS